MEQHPIKRTEYYLQEPGELDQFIIGEPTIGLPLEDWSAFAAALLGIDRDIDQILFKRVLTDSERQLMATHAITLKDINEDADFGPSLNHWAEETKTEVNTRLGIRWYVYN